MSYSVTKVNAMPNERQCEGLYQIKKSNTYNSSTPHTQDTRAGKYLVKAHLVKFQ